MNTKTKINTLTISNDHDHGDRFVAREMAVGTYFTGDELYVVDLGAPAYCNYMCLNPVIAGSTQRRSVGPTLTPEQMHQVKNEGARIACGWRDGGWIELGVSAEMAAQAMAPKASREILVLED